MTYSADNGPDTWGWVEDGADLNPVKCQKKNKTKKKIQFGRKKVSYSNPSCILKLKLSIPIIIIIIILFLYPVQFSLTNLFFIIVFRSEVKKNKNLWRTKCLSFWQNKA